MNNSYVNQFSGNIKFNYTCFDRVIIRGYIRKFFFEACIVDERGVRFQVSGETMLLNRFPDT